MFTLRCDYSAMWSLSLNCFLVLIKASHWLDIPDSCRSGLVPFFLLCGSVWKDEATVFYSPSVTWQQFPPPQQHLAYCFTVWSNWTSGLRAECEVSNTQTGRCDLESKGSTWRTCRMWTCILAAWRFISINTQPPFLQSSDPDFPKGHSLSSLMLSSILHITFQFIALSAWTNVGRPTLPNKSGERLPCRQVQRSKDAERGAFMKEVEGQGARWCCGSHCVMMPVQMPEGVQNCIAMHERWEISHDETQGMNVIDPSGETESAATYGEVKKCKIRFCKFKHSANEFQI